MTLFNTGFKCITQPKNLKIKFYLKQTEAWEWSFSVILS